MAFVWIYKTSVSVPWAAVQSALEEPIWFTKAIASVPLQNTYQAVGHRSYSGADFCASEITNLVPYGMQSFLLHMPPVTHNFLWWSYKPASLNYKMLT